MDFAAISMVKIDNCFGLEKNDFKFGLSGVSKLLDGKVLKNYQIMSLKDCDGFYDQINRK